MLPKRRASPCWPVRVLLDENVPADLAPELTEHEVETVSRLGWAGITNGELLRRARGLFDALVTMDQNLPFQQNLTAAAVGVVLVWAPSNRLIDDNIWPGGSDEPVRRNPSHTPDPV